MLTLTLTPFQEAYLAEYYPDQNFSMSTGLFASRFTTAKDSYRTLLQFDFSHLRHIVPSDNIVENAYLEVDIYRNEILPGQFNTLEVCQILDPWQSIITTWQNQPATEYIPAANYSLVAGFLGRVIIDVSCLASAWLDEAAANYGFLIKGNEDTPGLIAFRSTHYEDSSKWPRLVVSFRGTQIHNYRNFVASIPLSGFAYLGPVELAHVEQATYLVKNLGAGIIDAYIEISNDGNDWSPSHIFAAGIYPGSDRISLTVNAVARFVRLSLYGLEASTAAVSLITQAT